MVGNGRRVRFWLDKWCGNETLRDAFLSLYAIATSKEVGWRRFGVSLLRRVVGHLLF